MKIKYWPLFAGCLLVIVMGMVKVVMMDGQKYSRGLSIDGLSMGFVIASLCLLAIVIRWADRENPVRSGIYEFLMKIRAPEYDALVRGVTPKGDWQSEIPVIFREREIRGIVCGEEVIGIVENQKLFVAVSTKGTARMFRRCAGSNVTVVDVSSFT